MTRPLSPVEVESEIWRLSERAEQIAGDLAKRARAAAEAEVAYKVARAKALLVADGNTVSEREARADIATADQLLARKITEALLMAAQEAGRATRSQLDALRSINANLRSVT